MRRTRETEAAAGVVHAHPSAPIPVQGPGVGTGVRERLGETDLEVFPLMLGGGEFGWTVDERVSHAVLDRYLDYGGNVVHTADRFGGGRSEHIIGRWLRSRRVREDIVLAVRVGGHADHPGIGSVERRLSFPLRGLLVVMVLHRGQPAAYQNPACAPPSSRLPLTLARRPSSLAALALIFSRKLLTSS